MQNRDGYMVTSLELEKSLLRHSNTTLTLKASEWLQLSWREFALARRLHEKALRKAPSARIWRKSARLEWCLGDLERAKELIREGLEKSLPVSLSETLDGIQSCDHSSSKIRGHRT
ncbi:hypothetical protein KIN20_023226 [Parelaphostrongylus tenuis]|uniref:Tetratricopeptide repeat protein n=1 Tax=Parelaphostrongylus tenuis TaxID=148309 RepID=A0AAD5N8U7_PARTN|nr:hypothetical protein KIN20_023213 [Parelaphostrongylus tenuis]KAJ1363376.1 hypothetical protein KIN20_023226 [Parelaphostrongylus tenuis]